jgi:curved DNA-binding protein CbpA
VVADWWMQALRRQCRRGAAAASQARWLRPSTHCWQQGPPSHQATAGARLLAKPRRCLHCSPPHHHGLDPLDSTREDPYRLLGIAPTAEPDEIKRAFRDRALALHPDRVLAGSEAEQAEALRQFNAVVDAFEHLARSEKDWRFRQEADFAQWLRDELEWARARLRGQRERVLGTGDDSSNDSAAAAAAAASTQPRRTHIVPVKLRPEQQRAAEIRVARIRREKSRKVRMDKVEALEREQELEQELAWAQARADADRRQRGAPTAGDELAAAARRLAQMGINIDRINSGSKRPPRRRGRGPVASKPFGRKI